MELNLKGKVALVTGGGRDTAGKSLNSSPPRARLLP